MLQSMTGYGRVSGRVAGMLVTIDIRSLNSRNFDLNLKIPSFYKAMEPAFRKVLSDKIVRGKVDFSLIAEPVDEEGFEALHLDLIKHYASALSDLSQELKLENQQIISAVMQLPDLTISQREMDEQIKSELFKLFEAALEQLIKYRIEEGAAMAIDLNERVKGIEDGREKVIVATGNRVEEIKARIKKNLIQLKVEVNEDRYEQELIYYLEKLDISEELVRLDSHITFLKETIASAEDIALGKKLGFIGQEIGREINTIGSKANDQNIQRDVVQMKNELEKIKEQVANIL